MMNIAPFGDIARHFALEFLNIKLLWSTFQQLVQAFTQQPPAAAQHQTRNQNRQQRVDG